MQRYVLIIEYIGTNYAGSQRQLDDGSVIKNKTMTPIKTIQGEIEKALSTLTKQKIKTIFSGRTDAGVHAKGQVVHFDTDYDCLDIKFINALNGILPKDISIKKVEKTYKNFHAQKSARYRWYRYIIANRNQRSAWDKECLLYREELDIDRMNDSLRFLIGEHDFSSFKKANTTNPAKICKMYKASCFKENDKVFIDIIANRFLYSMVRSIVGTLLMIEKKSLAPETLKEILEAKDRSKAGPTISPTGLTLMKVIYNDKANMEIAYENVFS